MGREHKESTNLCYYCGCNLRKSHENDHMPIPTECGGVDTVPACQSCHDMKDRFPLETWSQDWWNAVMADFPKMSRETRIFLAKVARQFSCHLKDETLKKIDQASATVKALIEEDAFEEDAS